MLRIALCDDDMAFGREMAKLIQAALSKLSVLGEVSVFQSPKELLAAWEAAPFDGVFLDIDMPELSGFEVANTLCRRFDQPLIVFVTSKQELVFDSFNYRPFYFLCKTAPDILQADLLHVCQKLCHYLKQSRQIDVQDAVLGSLPVTLKDIVYIQSEKHYVYYYLRSQPDKPLKERGTLNTKANQLLTMDFCRPHQRYLVNMRYIDNFHSVLNAILLTTGQTVPLSKRMKEDTLNRYRIYRRK